MKYVLVDESAETGRIIGLIIVIILLIGIIPIICFAKRTSQVIETVRYLKEDPEFSWKTIWQKNQ